MRILTFSPENFPQFISHLNAGLPLIFPTDTSYGFSGDPFCESVVKRVEEIKGRQKKPFLLLVADQKHMEEYGDTSPLQPEHFFNAKTVPTTFLLPKTSILQKSSFFPDFQEIGLRIPVFPLLQEFLTPYAKLIFSTSANFSGEPPIFTTAGIVEKFSSLPDVLFADFGNLPVSPPSLILHIQSGQTEFLR